MSVKLNKVVALFIAVLTVLSAFSFVLPAQISVSAAEDVTVIANEAELRVALEGSGGSYSLSSDIGITVTEYEEFRYTVTKTVSIDLNGHKIAITNTSNLVDNTNDSTLIKVDESMDSFKLSSNSLMPSIIDSLMVASLLK